MRIDLKALLLISMSAPPDSVIRMNKRLQLGKASFMIRYELRKGDLIIHQMKKVRVGSIPVCRPKKHQRRQQRKLESGNTFVESSNRTSLSQKHAAVSTEKVVLVTTASQTSRRVCNSIQIDTSDLFPTYSKDQQTTSSEIQSSGSQTEDQVLQSRTTQAEISLKSWSTQTRIQNASLGSQTEIVCTSVGVQSILNGNDQATETDEVEEELIGPYLQALMLESIKNMSNLISNEVICAVSQVLDIRRLEVKQMPQEQDLPREGALEPLTPLPIGQIGNKFSSEKFITMAGITGLLSTMTSEAWLIKAKKLSAGHSWNCTMKCMHCSLHIHRNRLPIDTQSTQTEGKEDNKESEMAKLSIEMATQTEKSDKERSRWTLKRS